MVAIRSTLALAALTSVVAAQNNAIIVSIANDIVQGIIDAKTDDSVSDEQATSEIQAVVDIVTKNTDVAGLFTKALPVVALGLNSDNFPSLLDEAAKTLEAFQGSDDYPKAIAGFSAAFPHYDVPQALSNVIKNIGAVLAIVTPALPSLTPEFSSKWETATSKVLALATELGLLGGGGPKAVASATTSAAASEEATSTSEAAEPTSEAASKADAEGPSAVAPKSEAPKSEAAPAAKSEAAPSAAPVAAKSSAAAAPAAAKSSSPTQANAASAFNVQLAAGLAVVGAVAALI